MIQPIKLASLPDYVAHAQLCPLIKALREKKKIVVIAGAGMSVAAGIPTFDAMPIASTNIFEMGMYNNENDTKRLNEEFSLMFQRVQAASPTQFHHVLDAIAEEGRLHRLYTQNIDGLDTHLAHLKTQIPLSSKGPWPKTIQLHGDLRTVRCQGDPRHLSLFDPALFASEASSPLCTECKAHKRTGRVPVLRPRVWLYADHDYPDADAISSVINVDQRQKLDVVIVVGTALKVDSAKRMVKDMCTTVRQRGGIAVWINLKPPTQDLDFFDIVIEGDCETVAVHVSTWWLKVPLILSDTQIQDLQQRCKPLFIARSPGAVLDRALAELDADSLSQVLQEHANKSKIPKDKGNGKMISAPTKRSQPPSSSVSKAKPGWTSVNKPLLREAQAKSSGVLPRLVDCWRDEMSKRLSEVVVKVVVPKSEETQTENLHESSSVVTEIVQLGYQAKPERSLWRLKQGEYLNDEIINAYLELLQRSIKSPSNRIANTFTMKSHQPYSWLTELLETGTYTVYLPVHHERYHWSFAVITSENNEAAIQWTYYDSLEQKAPIALLEWIRQYFSDRTTKELTASPSPKQDNGTDCGLFVLIGIRLLMTGRPHLTQAESNDFLPSYRERVLAELLASSLDPSESQYEAFKSKENSAKHTLQSAGDNNSDDSDCVILSAPDWSHDDQCPLFISPSPVSDSSSSIGGGKTSPEHIASVFAMEATMLSTLKDAVAIERATHKQHSNLAEESLPLSKLWLMVKTEKRALKQRYIHYEFSRQFWSVMEGFNRGLHDHSLVPKDIISKVMDKLEITDQTNWKSILQRARRAAVWIELVDIFKSDLIQPSVVLCAVPNATYLLETLTITDRNYLLKAIRTRLKEPGNGIIARLKAADALHWALMHDGLPTQDLPIESAKGVLPFEQMVKIGTWLSIEKQLKI